MSQIQGFDLNIPLENLKNICRVCLTHYEPLLSIHEVVLSHNHNPEGSLQDVVLTKVFHKYCSIVVHQADLKPQKICMTCMNLFAKAFDIFELCRLSNQRLDKLLREHGTKIAKEQQDMVKLQNILQNIRPIGPKTPTEQPLNVDKAGNSNKTPQKQQGTSAKVLPGKQKDPVSKDAGKLRHKEHTNIDAETKKCSEVEIDSEHDNNHYEANDNDSEFDDNDEDNEEFEIQIVEEDERSSQDSKTEDIPLEEEKPKSSPKSQRRILFRPNKGSQKWDHTYNVTEPKYSILPPERKRKMRTSEPPKLKMPKLISEFKTKKMLLEYQNESDIFNCKFCEGLEFQGVNNVIEHVKSTHPFANECVLCAKTFGTFKVLLSHVASHAEKKELVCSKCFIYFKNKESLDIHRASEEHLNYTSTCSYCKHVFTNEYRLRKHIQEIHMNRVPQKVQCSVCGLILKKANLQKHLRSHKTIEERKSFLCEHCAKSFTSSATLKQHVSVVHEGQVHLKRVRDRIKNKEYTRRCRQKERGEFCCEYCSKIFNSKRMFFKHRISHPECTNIACPFCDKVFDNPAEYKYHRVKDHSTFICNVCDRGFPTNALLTQHKHNTHRPAMYQCSFCPRSFMSWQALLSHEKIHTKEKPYACKYCDKKFAQYTHVEHHEIAYHTKMKKHFCDFCDKSFRHNYNLQGHLRTHTGYKPFQCPYCSRKFTDTLGRHKHVKHDHPEKMDEFVIYKKENQSTEILMADLTLEKNKKIITTSSKRRRKERPVEREDANEVEEYEIVEF